MIKLSVHEGPLSLPSVPSNSNACHSVLIKAEDNHCLLIRVNVFLVGKKKEKKKGELAPASSANMATRLNDNNICCNIYKQKSGEKAII